MLRFRARFLFDVSFFGGPAAFSSEWFGAKNVATEGDLFLHPKTRISLCSLLNFTKIRLTLP